VSSFRQSLTAERQTGGYINGKWVIGTPTQVAFTASVQPANAKELQNLPEGRRTKSAFMLYTDTELLTSEDGATPKKADRITIAGDVFEVMTVERWQNQVIPHYSALVAKIG
jgi:hypothetical protein